MRLLSLFAAAVALGSPGPTIDRFAHAAAKDDAPAMWRLLSAPTRRRLGPTLRRFSGRSAPPLERRLRGFAASHVFLATRISADFAVAGTRTTTSAYASALRLEHGSWRLELGGLRLTPIEPHVGAQVTKPTQLVAQVHTLGALADAGLWLDGAAVPGRASRLSTGIVLLGGPVMPRPGTHAVVAFAATPQTAGAIAWPFRAGR